ncbi:MAG: multicopper oxidase domain-containing protein, partial [Nitrososphaeraceae archaeon]
QAERGIMEFEYKFPGRYMFHAHKTEFAEKGWMGTFFVNDGNSTQISTPGIDNNSFYDTLNNSFVTKKLETTGVGM